MATALAEAFVRIRVDPSQLKPDVTKALDGELPKAGDSAGKKTGSRFSGAFKGAIGGLAAGFAAGFAADKVVGFFKDAVSEASDLNEAGTKLQQLFGAGTPGIEKYAANGAKALGQSKLDVENAAATFGVYGKAAGLAGSANADFSSQLVGLSTDLASFYNVDPTQATEAIASGLRGEAEPLRQFGVLLDDASLRQQALKDGLISTTKQALTPQQKVLAAHALILQQTKVAQGDFTRTSGGLANQQRILSAQFTNLKGSIGAQLLPAMVGLATFMTTTVLPAFAGLGSIISSVAGFVSGNIKVFIALGVAIGVLTGLTLAHQVVLAISTGRLKEWIVQTAIVRTATAAWSAVQWLLNAAMSANPIGLVVIAIVALVAAIVIAYKKSETFRAIVTGAFNAVKGAAVAAFNWVKSNWPLLLAILTGPIGIAVLVISRNWDKIIGFFKGAPGKIKGALSGVAGFISAPFRAAFNAISDAWNNTAGRLSFHIPSWVPKIGGNGFSMPQLPHFASGVQNFAGGFAMVGERGPEVAWLPSGSNVTPHGRTPAGGGPLIGNIEKIELLRGGPADVANDLMFAMRAKGLA